MSKIAVGRVLPVELEDMVTAHFNTRSCWTVEKAKIEEVYKQRADLWRYAPACGCDGKIHSLQSLCD